MRILFVIDSLSGGGAEKLMSDMLPLIQKNNICELLLLTKRNDKYSEGLLERGIKVSVIPHSKHLDRIKYIRDYAIKNHFDVVHANLFPVTYYCAAAKKLSGSSFPALCMTEHNTDNRRRHIPWMRPLEKMIYSAYDGVISISQQTQEALLEWIEPKKKEKFVVIENGVPLQNFFAAQPYDKKEVVADYKDNEVLLGMVGSFTEQKGHTFMLEVLANLPTYFRLVCVGEGPMEELVRHKAEELKISNRITFLGFRKDVARIMKTVDISVIPSKWEGFGLVAVEAMACGNPIVVSDVPGLAEVVGDAGAKIPFGEVEQFADAVKQITLPVDSTQIIKQAEKYDIYLMKKRYMDAYSSFIYVNGC